MIRGICILIMIGASLSEPHTSESAGTYERRVHKNLRQNKDKWYEHRVFTKVYV